MSNPLKKLASQTAIYGLGNVLPRIISYVFSLILTYIFKEPSVLAPNAEFFAYISFLNIIFTYGMETAFFNFTRQTEDKNKVYSTALISILSSTVFFTLIVIAFSANIAKWIEYEGNTNFVIWCVLIVATDALMAIPFARLRLQNQAMRFASIKLINVVANILISVFYFIICKNAFHQNPESFLGSLYNPQVGVGYAFLASLYANLICLAFLYKEFIGIEYFFDKELWKKMFKYAWPLIILGLAGMTNETFDRIILKYLLPKDVGTYQLGVYSACYKIAMFMTIFTTAFKYAAEPFFFNNTDEKNSKKTIAVVMKYYVLFCLFIFLGTMMNLPWLKHAISAKFQVGIDVVPILLIANLCLGVYWNLSVWYKLTGKTTYGAVITIIGAFITLLFNFIGIPYFGFMACAWATLTSYSVMMVISYLLGQKHYPINYNLRSMFVFVALALALYGVSLLYANMENTIIKLLLNNVLLALFAWFFYKLEFDNLKKLKQL